MLKYFRKYDWWLFLFPALLWIASLTVLWSLTYANPDKSVSSLAVTQLIYGILGLILMVVVSLIDYRELRSLTLWIAIITLLLLVAVAVVGKSSLGATRWLDLKVFRLQPSEIAKLALAIVLAGFLAPRLEHPDWRTFMGAMLILVLPLILVVKQPDLGTGIILAVETIGMIMALRLKYKHYVVIIVTLAVIVGVGTLAFLQVRPFNHLLKSYQRGRIEVFLNPRSDPLGKGYNVNQAIIAIGNGGLTGRGLNAGAVRLSQLNFLPNAYSDFIFAAMSEAVGFVGMVILLLIFGGFLWRILVVAATARDAFGVLISYGFFSIIIFSILVNVGMNLGVMPVTGIPLPFVSAGGTALIMNFVGVGILQSVESHHRAINFD